MHRSVLMEPDMRCCEIKWNGLAMLRNLYVSSCWMANSKSSIAAACRGHIVSKFAKFYKYPGAKKCKCCSVPRKLQSNYQIISNFLEQGKFCTENDIVVYRVVAANKPTLSLSWGEVNLCVVSNVA